MEITPGVLIWVVIIALICQFMSVSFGVGYGTILTPLLLILGFSALRIIPVVLFSQLVGGIVGGLAHYKAGNITLDFRRDDKLIKERLRGLGYIPRSKDSKLIIAFVTIGVVGVILGAFTAVNIPGVVLKTYIGVMVLVIGFVVLLRRDNARTFSWKGLITIGLIGAFNKGISGGGYVPLITGGQIIVGHGVKSSVGNTTVAVTIICAVGFLSHLVIGEEIYWLLAAITSLGSVIAAPFAAYTVKKVSSEKIKFIIGAGSIMLGILTLGKIFIF